MAAVMVVKRVAQMVDQKVVLKAGHWAVYWVGLMVELKVEMLEVKMVGWWAVGLEYVSAELMV